MATPGRTTSLSSAPRTDAETREIVLFTQSLKETYPNIKSAEDVDGKHYRDLITPLRKRPTEINKYYKTFHGQMVELEGELSKVALMEFSYDRAKTSATKPAETHLFTDLEQKIDALKLTHNVGNPHLNKIFSALTDADFTNNLRKANLIHPLIGNDRDFQTKARAVFDYIKTTRERNKTAIQQGQIEQYLEEIFKGSEDKIDDKIDKSTIIRKELITSTLRTKIFKGYDQYHAFKTTLKTRVEKEGIITKQKETVLSKPVKYLRSGEKYIAEKIQSFRENWAGLTGKEKVVAGAALLIGFSWFLNSNNEHAVKVRELLGKAGMMGIGLMGANIVTKAITGKGLDRMAATYLEDKSGKRDVLKDSFNTDKNGAETLNASLAMLGAYDFGEVGKLYLQQQARYSTYPMPDNMKELPIGGVANSEMTPNQMFIALRLVDRKLKKEGSSIERVVNAIDDMEKESRRTGKKFTRPTYAEILSSILMNQAMKLEVKGNTIGFVKVKEIETKWKDDQIAQTSKWWLFTGTAKEWRNKLIHGEQIPREKTNANYLKEITKYTMPDNRELSTFIDDKKFGRYTPQFQNLYNLAYKKQPAEKFNSVNDNNSIYMTSKVRVDTTTFTSLNEAKVAAAKNAYQQAMAELEKKYINTPGIAGRIHEFAQPIAGVFLAPAEKSKYGTIAGKNKPTQYVMFIRMVIPGNIEFDLRKNKEWPEGDMIQQMNDKPMTGADRLSRSDFKAFSKIRRRMTKSAFGQSYTHSYDWPNIGIYETFLTRFGLGAYDKQKIDKVLESYSIKFKDSGITKAGLMRYLATHNFTAQERKSAVGENLDVFKFDFYNELLKATKDAVDIPGSGFDATKKKRLVAEMMSKLGNLVMMTFMMDVTALGHIGDIDAELVKEIVAVMNPVGGPKTPGMLNESDLKPKLLDAYIQTIRDAIQSPAKMTKLDANFEVYTRSNS